MDGWVRSRFHPMDGGGFAIERVQDVEDILDQNKRYQNEPQQKSELMGHHVASIPLVVIEKWANEDGAHLMQMNKYEADRYLKRKLRDPDWAHLRTR